MNRKQSSRSTTQFAPSPGTLAVLRSYRLRRSMAPVVERLGGLQAVYEAQGTPLWLRLLGPLCILFGLLILGVLWHNYTLLLNLWSRLQIGAVLALSGLWLLIGIMLSLAVASSRRLRVLICSSGLIVSKRKAFAIQWDDIQSFWKDIRVKDNVNVTRSYRIRTIEGKSFTFDDTLPDVARLGRRIERKVTNARLPELLDAYYAGKPVIFGSLMLSSDGLHIRDRELLASPQKRQHRQPGDIHSMLSEAQLLPWGELERLNADDTTLSVYKKGQYWDWHTLPVADIPNAEILKNMAETISYELRQGPLQHNIALFRSHMPVTFGDLRISTQSVDIDNGKISLPWSELDSIGIGEQEVIIKRKGTVEEWYALPLWRVENASQLKDLVDYLMQII